MLLPRPPNTIIRLLAASYTAVWIERGGGEPAAPCATVLVHTDVPPSPFALESTQTALLETPPNTIILLLEASYTAVGPARPIGEPAAPCATVLVHTDVPPSPFALESTQTSLYMLLPRPPNTIIRLLYASYTAVWIDRGRGEPAAPCATETVHTSAPPSPFA